MKKSTLSLFTLSAIARVGAAQAQDFARLHDPATAGQVFQIERRELTERTSTPRDVVSTPVVGVGGNGSVSRSFTGSAAFGDGDFGAGYVSSAALRGSTADGTATVNDDLDVYVVFVGQRVDLAGVRASTAATRATSTTRLRVLRLGQVLNDVTVGPGRLNTAAFGALFTYSESWTVWAGPVPVTFRVAVAGAGSASAAGVTGPTVMSQHTLTPSINLTGTGQGSVGATIDLGPLGSYGAEAGASGTLQLITVSHPLTAYVGTGPVTYNWNLSLQRSLSTLNGRLDLYAQVCFFGCDRWDVNVARWSGLTFNDTPWTSTGLISLNPPPPN